MHFFPWSQSANAVGTDFTLLLKITFTSFLKNKVKGLIEIGKRLSLDENICETKENPHFIWISYLSSILYYYLF